MEAVREEARPKPSPRIKEVPQEEKNDVKPSKSKVVTELPFMTTKEALLDTMGRLRIQKREMEITEKSSLDNEELNAAIDSASKSLQDEFLEFRNGKTQLSSGIINERGLKASEAYHKDIQSIIEKLTEENRIERENITKFSTLQAQTLQTRELEARQRLLHAYSNQLDSLKAIQNHVIEDSKEIRARTRMEFNEMDKSFYDVLKSKGKVAVMPGSISESLEYTPKHYILTEIYAYPLPMKWHVRQISGIGEKLSAGKYYLEVSVLEDLGGLRLQFGSRDIEQTISTPKLHRGHYYNKNFEINERLVVNVAPRREASTNHAYLIKLYRAYQTMRMTEVVGWGIFPVYNHQAEPNSGCFRIPLLSGVHDRTEFDRYWQVERAYATDVSKWLGNLYVEIELANNIDPMLYNVDAPTRWQSLFGKPNSAVSNTSKKPLTILDVTSSQDATTTGPAEEPQEEADVLEDENLQEDEDSIFDPSKYKFSVYSELVPKVTPSIWKSLDFHKTFLSPISSRHRSGYYLAWAQIGIALWLRQWVHYLGASLMIYYSYSFLYIEYSTVWKMAFVFPVVNLPIGSRVVIFGAGPFFCMLTAAILYILSSQSWIFGWRGRVSFFAHWFGLFAALDILLVLIIDLIDYVMRRFISVVLLLPCRQNVMYPEISAIYDSFVASQGSGAFGTLFIFVLGLMAITISLTLFFIMELLTRRQSRVLDTYRRQTGTEGDFFLPFDDQISKTELSVICAKAESWVGPKGERRTVDIYNRNVYIYQSDKKDSDEKKLWRSFEMRLPDGEIIETSRYDVK